MVIATQTRSTNGTSGIALPVVMMVALLLILAYVLEDRERRRVAVPATDPRMAREYDAALAALVAPQLPGIEREFDSGQTYGLDEWVQGTE